MVTKGAALLTVLTAIENSGISTKTCTCIHSDHAAWRGRVPDPADAAMMLDSGLIDESQRDVHIINGHSAQCPNRKPGPLHIVGGRVDYTTATGYRLEGTVGSQGELTMRSEMVASSPASSDAGLRHSRREPHDPRSSERFGL